MSASLLQLMAELLQAIEQRDAGDPDAPAWEASARIVRLEEEIAQRLDAGADRGSMSQLRADSGAAEGAVLTA